MGVFMGRSSRRRRRHVANSTAPIAPASPRSKLAIRTALLFGIFGIVALFVWPPWKKVQLQEPREGRAGEPLVKFAAGPKDLKALTALEPAALAELDIARVNLLCAENLPGAEKLDVPGYEAELDRWAERVRFETDRHLYQFRSSPAEYENSEGYFRMLVLVTVLQKDLGVHYNKARIREVDFTHSADLFIHGMIPAPGQAIEQTNGGTCVSMPVIYTAVARRLSYPIKLVTAKSHLFCRWDAPDNAVPAWRGRFNIEGTNRGMNSFPDDYYKTGLYAMSDAEIKAFRHLQSLTPAEELAEFLATRGHCLLENGRAREALDAYNLAVKLAPSDALLAGFRSDALRKLDPHYAETHADVVAAAPRRPQPTYDPLAGVEDVEVLNRANLERAMESTDMARSAAAPRRIPEEPWSSMPPRPTPGPPQQNRQAFPGQPPLP